MADTSSTLPCTFNDCDQVALRGSDKCKFHKARKQCCVPDCFNIVYARNLCVRHGGKKKCAAPGCKANAYGGEYCGQHGGVVSKRFCKENGCNKQAHARGLCVRHGGGRICTLTGCVHHAREAGLCQKHLLHRGGVKKDHTQPTHATWPAKHEPASPILANVPGSCDPQPHNRTHHDHTVELTHVEFMTFLNEYFEVDYGQGMSGSGGGSGFTWSDDIAAPLYIL